MSSEQSRHTSRSVSPGHDGCRPLPEWPVRTIALLTTVGSDGPHTIPVSAPVRAGDHRILLNLHRTRGSLQRLRTCPCSAITILAAENVAFTARGNAHVVQETMSTGAEYAAVALDVDQLDDHRQPAFTVEAGIARRWLNEDERASLGQRVRELGDVAVAG